jgi:hypothetical protein
MLPLFPSRVCSNALLDGAVVSRRRGIRCSLGPTPDAKWSDRYEAYALCKLQFGIACVAHERRAREGGRSALDQGRPLLFRESRCREPIGQPDHPGRAVCDASRDDLTLEAACKEDVIRTVQQSIGKLASNQRPRSIARIARPRTFPLRQFCSTGYRRPREAYSGVVRRWLKRIPPYPLSPEQQSEAARRKIQTRIAVLDGPAASERHAFEIEDIGPDVRIGGAGGKNNKIRMKGWRRRKRPVLAA